MISLPGPVQLANANNPNRDGTTGTYSDPVVVGGNGARITSVGFQAITTTAAGTIRLFLSPDSGATWFMIFESKTPAVTVSATVPGANVQYVPPQPFFLSVPPSAQLKFTFANNSESWVMLVGGVNN